MFKIGDQVKYKLYPDNEYIVVECGEGGAYDSGGGVWIIGWDWNSSIPSQRVNPAELTLVIEEESLF